jgi:hypothetical protein
MDAINPLNRRQQLSTARVIYHAGFGGGEYALLGSIDANTVDVSALPTSPTNGAWSKSTAAGGTLTDQGTYLRLLCDATQATSKAHLIFTPPGGVWTAGKRIAVVARFASVNVGLPNTGGALRNLVSCLVFDDTRSPAATSIAFPTQTRNNGVMTMVQGTTGNVSGIYRANRSAVGTYLLRFGAGNADTMPDQAIGLEAEGDICGDFPIGLRTGSIAADALRFQADYLGLDVAAQAVELRVESCAVYQAA